VETLTRLKSEHPDWEIHFVVGSDWAAAWSQWRARQRLNKLCRWWTAPRPGACGGRIPAHFTLIRKPMPDVSSTGLRADLAAGLDCSRWLHPRMESYIARRGLYGTGLLAALQGGLKSGRFSHIMAVRRLAEALARHWGEDPRRASLAALLHDCGRLIKRQRLARYALDHRLRVPLLETVAHRQPGLLHAYAGEDLARRRFGCRDRAVLRAVRNHTLGSPSMSRLERILYVADAASEDRVHPHAAPLRRLAFLDLESAFAASLAAKLCHALEQRDWVHPLSVSLWNRLCARP
jgi:predicted HD superfamily hydrolase involved in NAD metabolism